MIWLVLAVFIAGWLVATWWFADDEPVIGPATDKRVTFKRVLQNVLRDGIDLASPALRMAQRLWAFWGPRVTNRAMLATVFADLAIVASGQDVWAFIGERPLLALGIVAMNLLTPLTPNGAPVRLPPAPSPSGGLVNNQAIS